MHPELFAAALSILLSPQRAATPPDIYVTPQVQLEIRGAFGDPNEDWVFYFVRGSSDQFVVKRTQNNDNARVTWARDDQCEGIRSALGELQTLPVPQPFIPGIPRSAPPKIPPFDGIVYSVKVAWGEWRDSNSMGLAFSGNVDSPLARWAQNASASLSECWTPDRPADIPANL